MRVLKEKRMTEKKTIEKKQSNIPEIILVTLGTIVWGVLYVLSIFQVDAGILAQSEYLVQSFVEKDNGVPRIEFGVAWIYIYILRTVFYVFGNHAHAALWLQFVLQLLGAVLLYRGVRKLYGRVVAVILYLGALFLPCFLTPVEEAQPLWIVFFAVALVIYFVATLLYSGKKRKTERETPSSVTAEKVAHLQAKKEDRPMKKNKNKTKSEMPMNADSGKTQSSENIEVQAENEAKPQVKLLDNPLPGPKKHVSKVLDYDLKLERMPRVFQRYDIKVSDDDDFDIK